MAVSLIATLLAGEVAHSAWGLGRVGLRELIGRDQAGRLLVLLYNDYGEASGLDKSAFYALAKDPSVGPEINLVVAGRRRITSDDDVAAVAEVLEPHLSAANEDPADLARRIASDAIAVASFAAKSPPELLRFLVATTDEIEEALADVKQDTESILEGQQRLEEQLADAMRELETISAENSQREVVRFVHTDWGPEPARRALTKLGQVDPKTLGRLQSALGDPPTDAALASLIRELPGWLRAAGPEALAVVAILCQQFRRWGEAGDTWLLAAAAATNGPPRGDLFMRAAIARKVSGDRHQYLALLERARSEDPAGVRLLLESASDLRDPNDQLAALETLSSDDRELQALIEAQRALACLLNADLSGAREHLGLARQQAAWMRQLDGVDVNIAVQEGRLAVSRDRAVNVEALYRAETEAERLRNELLANGRFEESGRILMLQCDAQMLLGDVDKALELLEAAGSEELAASDNAEVLAEVALRLSQYRLALKLLDGSSETPGAIRQRACALMHTGSSESVLASLETLHEIALGDTAESLMAGANLILAFAEEPRLAWDEEVADKLMSLGHQRVVVGARARQLAAKKYFEEADSLLEPYMAEIWALETKLVVEITRGRPAARLAAADALLAVGPDPAMTLLCAKVIASGPDKSRAAQLAVGLARGQGASVRVRADAYHFALALLANDLDAWERIPALWDEWQGLVPSDPRLPAWYARILGHPTAR